MRRMCYVSGNILFVRSFSFASFGHVQNFERTPPNKYVRWMNVTHALVCGMSGSRAVCPVLMRSVSCMYPLMSVRHELWTVKYKTYDIVPQTSTACTFRVRLTNVWSVSYTVHIRFVRYTSVTRTWVYRSLSVTCPVHMHSLRLPRRPSSPPRRLPSPDKYFCPFSVRSASVTFMWQHHLTRPPRDHMFLSIYPHGVTCSRKNVHWKDMFMVHKTRPHRTYILIDND